jgi:hypothetical protein
MKVSGGYTADQSTVAGGTILLGSRSYEFQQALFSTFIANHSMIQVTNFIKL